MYLRDGALPKREPLPEGDPHPPEDRLTTVKAPSIEDVYRKERPKLLSLLRFRTTPDHAQDVVQQVFTQIAALEPERASAISRLEHYLRRSVSNLLTEEARVGARRSVHLHGPDEWADLRAPDQIAALEARDMLRRMEEAMRRLKPRTREIFLAHRLDGYTYAEIAARTGLTERIVERHMSKAIAHIDRHLGRR